MVTGIVFEDKDIVDFGFMPNPACHAKKQEK
jgi:hypothetical protein